MRQAASGEWVAPYGEQVIESLGLSPGAAALIYGGAGLALGGVAGIIASGSRAAESGGIATAETAGNVSTKPQWLQNLDDSKEFNAAQASNYTYNEVYISKSDGKGYYRLDSYDPNLGEIISRKYTQLSDVQESTAVGYVNEIASKYPVGSMVASVPSSGDLAGMTLQG